MVLRVNGSLPADLRNAVQAWADPEIGAPLWHERLATWLAQLLPELAERLKAPAYSLGLSLVSDEEIAELNKTWRQIAGPTDVLAFAAQDESLADESLTDESLADTPPVPLAGVPLIDAGEELELGDIVISLETAARQAPEHGHNLEQELLFLACHGLLHLLGWDHPDEASLAAMLSRQEALLALPVQPA